MLQNEYVDAKVISWNTLRGCKLDWIGLRKDVQLLEFALIITTTMNAAILHCSCRHQTDIKLSGVVSLSTTLVFWDDGPGRLAVTETSGVLRTPDTSITICQSTRCNIQLYTDRHKHRYALCTGRKLVNNSNWLRWKWCSGKSILRRQNSFPSVVINHNFSVTFPKTTHRTKHRPTVWVLHCVKVKLSLSLRKVKFKKKSPCSANLNFGRNIHGP
jgi:hypothetical protein